MKILQRIKGYFTPKPDLIHPVFGELFSDCIGDEDGMWQSSITFTPTGRIIGLTINAGVDGPTDSQVNFYKKLEANHINEIEFVKPILSKEYLRWFNKPLVGNVYDVFTLTGVTIPRSGNRINKWSLSFETEEDLNHTFTVYIEGGTPKWCSVDG